MSVRIEPDDDDDALQANPTMLRKSPSKIMSACFRLELRLDESFFLLQLPFGLLFVFLCRIKILHLTRSGLRSGRSGGISGRPAIHMIGTVRDTDSEDYDGSGR